MRSTLLSLSLFVSLFVLFGLSAASPVLSHLPRSGSNDHRIRATSVDTAHEGRCRMSKRERSMHDFLASLCALPGVGTICRGRISSFANGLDRPIYQTVTTPLGTVSGAALAAGVTRFTLPYAQAPLGPLRFMVGGVVQLSQDTMKLIARGFVKPPQSVKAWPGSRNASVLAPACPQNMAQSTIRSDNEDCLFANIYQPASTNANSKLPVFVWIHGGSFVSGGIIDEAIDGTVLAAKGNMIVITLQYRLGALGFLRVSNLGINGNMAVLDVIEALSFIQENIASFGGDTSRITLAGHSSGAQLIKTLLSTPRADALFQRAILQSAPLNFGDHPVATAEAVGQVMLGSTGCKTLRCLQAAPTGDLLTAQGVAFSAAAQVPGVAASEPFRPLVDGSLVVQPFLSLVRDGGLSNTRRELLFTTVRNEAGPQTWAVSSAQPVMPNEYAMYINYLIDPTRAQATLASPLYQFDPARADGERVTLEEWGTDWAWRCANQQVAINITIRDNAPKVYLAQFDSGLPSPMNSRIDFCADKVCHEDDIRAVFKTGGTSLSPTQSALSTEVLARWSAFAATGSPNTAQYTEWSAVAPGSKLSTRLNMLVLDGSGSSIVQQQRQAACGPNGFWGRGVMLFDEQIYNSA